MRVSFFIPLLLSCIITLLPAGSLDEQLLAAVRAGDEAQVAALLEKGADANAAGRYQASALTFASDRGNVPIIRLLLAKGANVDARDTFYGATPVTWAAYNHHLEAMKVLLEHGASDVAAPLMLAVQENNEAMLQIVLATGKATVENLSSALSMARRSDNEPIAALLLKAGAQEPVQAETVTVAAALLNSYAGVFQCSDIDMEMTLSLADGKLTGAVANQPPLTYIPENDSVFTAVEFDGIKLIFHSKNNLTSRFRMQQGDRTYVFLRKSESATETTPPKPAATPLRHPGNAGIIPRNWPSFRGPGASGVSDRQYPPLEWSAESGHNIRWKTAIPGLAHSSPVVWEERVYLTTAVSSDTAANLRVGLYGDVAPDKDLSEHSWRVYCLDRNSGAVLWEREAHRGTPKVMRHTKATQANSTPVTDGKHVVVLFGAEGLYCYSAAGALLWQKDLGYLDSGWFYDPDYQWGHGSSPVIYRDMVIVQADNQKDSFVAAFRLSDGAEMWRSSRDEIPSWSSPTVVYYDGKAELITNGTQAIRAYDPQTGQEIWQLRGNSEIAVPTPFMADGRIFVSSGYRPIQPIYAIKPGARGDISLAAEETANEFILWSTRRGGPYMPTPLVYGGRLYVCANNGTFSCYDAATGKQHFRERLGGRGGGYAFTASPVAADGYIYLSSEDGDIYVAEAGESYNIVTQNDVAEVVMATPAISAGMLIIRGQKHLFGIAVMGDR